MSPSWSLPWASGGVDGRGSGGGGGGSGTPSTAAAQRRGPWGFASGMPSLEELFSAAAARLSPQSPAVNDLTASATAPTAPGTSGPGPLGQPTTAQPPATANPDLDRTAGLIESQPAASPGSIRTYVQRLGDSRAFHCPDATEAMAEACGVAQSLGALQVCYTL